MLTSPGGRKGGNGYSREALPAGHAAVGKLGPSHGLLRTDDELSGSSWRGLPVWRVDPEVEFDCGGGECRVLVSSAIGRVCLFVDKATRATAVNMEQL